MKLVNKTANIGISTWVYFWRPLAEVLREIAKAGYSYIEIWGDKAHLDPTIFPNVSSLKRLLKELHLQSYSLHAPFSYVNIASLDDEYRKHSIRIIKKSIELCSKVEGKIVIIHPHSTGMFPDLKDCPQMIHKIEESVRELTFFAKRFGIKIGVENIPYLGGWDFGSKISNLVKLIEKIDSDELGLCLDTGHIFVGRENVDLSRNVLDCGKSLIALHIQDTDGEKDQHWLPGEGIIDWSKFSEDLGSINYQEIFMLEVSGSQKWTGHNVNNVLQRGLAGVRRILE